MTLTFLGTRGNIPIFSPRHRRHSAALLSTRKDRVLLDCGSDWLGGVGRLHPTAVIVTHGHPDHAAGLKRGVACPVYATADTWRIMARWPLPIRCELPLRHPIRIGGVVVEAWPVQHSLNAPAVGLKLSTRAASLFYVPDVASLDRSRSALRHVDLYVGDGAVLNRPLLRVRDGALIGHASLVAQLEWCRAAGVRRAIFTHCGSGIVRSDSERVEAVVRSLGRDRGIEARLAHDGLRLSA